MKLYILPLHIRSCYIASGIRESDEKVKLQGNGKWIIAFLFLPVISVSLVVAFWQSGSSQGPLSVTETVVLDPVVRELERPLDLCEIWENLSFSYCDAGWINGTVSLPGMHDGDWATLKVQLQTALDVGEIERVDVSLESDCPPTHIWFPDRAPNAVLANLSVLEYGMTHVSLLGLNHPRESSLECWPVWSLGSSFNETERLDVNVDVTYSNGTCYKKVTSPFSIVLTGDNDDSFDAAVEVQANQTVNACIGGLRHDPKDYHKIYLEEGDILSVNATAFRPWQVSFYLYLYSPADTENPVSSCFDYGKGSLEYIINSTGYWYVEVRCVTAIGHYSLTLSVSRD